MRKRHVSSATFSDFIIFFFLRKLPLLFAYLLAAIKSVGVCGIEKHQRGLAHNTRNGAPTITQTLYDAKIWSGTREEKHKNIAPANGTFVPNLS